MQGIGLALLSMLALSSARGFAATSTLCHADEALEKELASIDVESSDPFDFERRVAPYRTVRDRHPDDVYAQIAYQDAVKRNGIEGHLKKLIDEYQASSRANPKSVLRLYLFGRSLQWRATRQAAATMERVLAVDHAYAPAYRTLIEIHSNKLFADADKLKKARADYAALCPGSEVRVTAFDPPPRTKGLERAESLLAQKDQDEVPAIVARALEEEEWRLQRTRPFDVYPNELKVEIGHEVQASYWRASQILIRHWLATDAQDRVTEELTRMEQRLSSSTHARDTYPFWIGANTLFDFYASANRIADAKRILEKMEQELARKPDRTHAAEIAQRKKRLAKRS